MCITCDEPSGRGTRAASVSVTWPVKASRGVEVVSRWCSINEHSTRSKDTSG
jgi:hypothetical protein